MRERPLRERKLKRIEDDQGARERTISEFPIPDGSQDFRAGYRECLSMYALHAPNKRGVGRILERHCTILEEACLTSMTRENVAQYEGYRQAIKDLRRMRRIR